jgi:RNA polymerase sigma-70 factor (ECF subfamily)
MDSPLPTSLAGAPPCFAPLHVERTAADSARRATDQQTARWFREEIQVHEPALRAYLRSRFSALPDADDLIQDCYARLLRQRQQGPVPVTRAYLFVVARNAALDLLRRRRIVALEPLDQAPSSSVVDDGMHAADQICQGEELALLDAAIRELPPRCRDIVVLRRLHGLSYQEIARRLQISESTVHAQLCLGLKRCRAYLCAHGVTKACLALDENA